MINDSISVTDDLTVETNYVREFTDAIAIADAPWINPSTFMTIGGTPDGVGVVPGTNTAPARIYQVLYFDEFHADAETTAIIEGLIAKFDAP